MNWKMNIAQLQAEDLMKYVPEPAGPTGHRATAQTGMGGWNAARFVPAHPGIPWNRVAAGGGAPWKIQGIPELNSPLAG
jgi:hypothetical protein